MEISFLYNTLVFHDIRVILLKHAPKLPEMSTDKGRRASGDYWRPGRMHTCFQAFNAPFNVAYQWNLVFLGCLNTFGGSMRPLGGYLQRKKYFKIVKKEGESEVIIEKLGMLNTCFRTCNPWFSVAYDDIWSWKLASSTIH